ncbi:MAG: type II toxin-antitoxin system death-on-curing family toxin [Chloroflexota bacterium]
MTRYLTLYEMMIINEEIIGGRSQLRDVDLLEAAVLRPQASAFGEDAYPTVPEKAAALFHSLARNHAFVDGNKRTATVATIIFLELNHYTVRWNDEEALDFIVEAATGRADMPVIAEWIAAHAIPQTVESMNE